MLTNLRANNTPLIPMPITAQSNVFIIQPLIKHGALSSVNLHSSFYLLCYTPHKTLLEYPYWHLALPVWP